MPYYLKKSISAGPFRFNLSKSGVGLSVGVKGLRVGSGPRGHYIHAGRKGIYYRKSLNKAGVKKAVSQNFENHFNDNDDSNNVGVVMKEIDSSEVLKMVPEQQSALLVEINSNHKKSSYVAPLVTLGVLLMVVGFLLNSALGLIGAIFPIFLYSLGKKLDQSKNVTVMFYDLDEAYTENYTQLIAGFDKLISANRICHVKASGEVKTLVDWKRNAGAKSIVEMSEISPTYVLPKFIKSNLIPPSIDVGTQNLYFFPDMVMIVDGMKVGAISYSDIFIRENTVSFIEDQIVPSDAEIISYNWKHPNKSGGPDRRFRDNYEIPVCRYGRLHLFSETGLNELLQVSNPKTSNLFGKSILRLGKSLNLAS